MCGWPGPVARRALLGVVVLVAACSPAGEVPVAVSEPAAAVGELSPAATPPPRTIPPPPSPTPRPVVEVAIRLVSAVDDISTGEFGAFAAGVLNDPRGWRRAGFRFRFAEDAPYMVVVAEGPEVDRLCLPYDTGGRYSCQNGAVVALNADRWRSATDTWPASLVEYRTMLVNHEVGHLLGQHHPERKCAVPGRRAAVMAQQSAQLDGCAPGLWPLRWEIACAARHEEPLAPGYEEEPRSQCGPASIKRRR